MFIKKLSQKNCDWFEVNFDLNWIEIERQRNRKQDGKSEKRKEKRKKKKKKENGEK
jgi:hypothetical protein